MKDLTIALFGDKKITLPRKARDSVRNYIWDLSKDRENTTILLEQDGDFAEIAIQILNGMKSILEDDAYHLIIQQKHPHEHRKMVDCADIVLYWAEREPYQQHDAVEYAKSEGKILLNMYTIIPR